MIITSAKERIFERFLDGALANKNVAEICKILSIPYRERTRLIPLLNELCAEGKLYKTENGKYGTIEQLGLIKGTISGNERGFGFLVPEDKESYPNDYFIPRKYMHGAFHGDVALVEQISWSSERETERDEARVVKILQRGYHTIVGVFRKDKRAGYLYPDEKKFSAPIYIPLSSCHQIRNGVKAVAKITEYPQGKAPGGEIIEVLGDEEDFFAEELSIIRSYNLREEFPSAVEKEAEKQQKRGVTASDLQRRKDFRDKLVVTIDGEDTRDIDDAISLEKVGENYLLSVHIADVSHYVPARGVLDDEAFARGTSVYFPDCVLPMLPRALSNGICSLNEGEDRLTLSCLMKIDKQGRVKESEIVEGVIRSAHKMTYTEITKILDGDKDACDKYQDVLDMVNLFAQLTRILQEKRNKKGSVTLDVKEAKILFDKETNEITIPDYERAFSYQIIEAFMVLANETVAEYMHSIEAPFIYRIHEKPSEEKARTFRAFAQGLGLTARFNAEDVKPYDYQNLLLKARDLPSYSVLNRVMLRSMQKARYSPENVGHFGLASDCYCHFTSPIRRYPDLCIHRIIKEVVNGNYAEAVAKYGGFVERAAEQSSDRERKAADAERDVDDLYKTMFMSERIGEEYEAVISGVTSFGLFAELPNTIEGFIPIESLYGTYKFNPDNFTLTGGGKSYSLGETLLVKVVDVDFYRRRTEFRLLKKLDTTGENI
ncbi:MAG: ribonuclease R [Clostridiales bacterium]|nr:ribonuclease R [Clostridiales bacterium]